MLDRLAGRLTVIRSVPGSRSANGARSELEHARRQPGSAPCEHAAASSTAVVAAPQWPG